MVKKKKKGIFKKIIVLLFLGAMIVAGIGGKYWYENYKVVNIEFDGDSKSLFIPKESTKQSVLNQIESLGIALEV